MANDPFARHSAVPTFNLTSDTVEDGATFAPAQMSGSFGIPGGEDVSPQLSWSGAPEGTLSYAVTVYDPDAPTMSGFWHWAVANIPSSCTSLAENAGAAASDLLPEGSYQLRNDAGQPHFVGAAPPAGHGEHRYFISVHALDVADIGVPADASPAFLGFNLNFHTLARATIVAHAEIA